MKNKPLWKLYWVTTLDHDEDWFVVSRSARSARSFFEQYEGYDSDYAESELVCRVPDKMQESCRIGHPSVEFLVGCGGESFPNREKTALHDLLGCGQRAFKFGDRIYSEGDIVANTSSIISKAEDRN
jgi:hypothetical protein